jgi:octaprenyl-diphosphate synthase
MALAFLIVLATAHFENANLVVLAVCHHRGFDSCTGHQGRAHLDFSAVSNGQNLVDHDLLANVRSNLFYFDLLASGNTILFATGFYDRVHNDLFEEWLPAGPKSPVGLRTNFHRTHDFSRFFKALQCLVPRSISLNTKPAPPDALSLIASDMAAMDRVIAARLHTGVPLVGEVSRYIISAGGKRLRPALLLLMAGALGCHDDQRHVLAAVVEFIHTATLLHDDVVDDSALRRGRATANVSFGNPASVLVGDFLYSRAFQMMVECGSMRIMDVMAEATNVIAEGEVHQLMNMHDADLTEAQYIQVIRSKTAKLFEASARLPAILSGATADIEQACADYGQAIGSAFQIIDDVLDYEGDAEQIGKNLGDDLREGKNTLPLIIAMQRCAGAERELIRQAIEQGDASEMQRIVDLVRRCGAMQATRDAAAAQAELALQALRVLPDNAHTVALQSLAAQLTSRQS